MPDAEQTSEKGKAARPSARTGSLLFKFLLILVPVFLVLAVPSIGFLVAYELREDQEALAARLGNQAARATAALGRHDVTDNPSLAQDLIAPLAAERAFICAEFRTGTDGKLLTAQPPALGCSGRTDGYKLSLPVGDDSKAVLLIRFSDAGLREAEQLENTVSISVVAVSFVLALLASFVGFRLIVNRPLRTLLGAIRQWSETGRRQPIPVRSNDELGRVIAAFNEMVERETQRKIALTHASSRLQASEARLKNMNEELECRVRERTADLEMEKARAESASLAKSRFLASMSHELRTPLNSIIGFAEILKTQALGKIGNSRYTEFSEDIYGSGQHLLRIINDILDISKIESGSMGLREEEAETAEIIGDTLRLVQPMCTAADVELRPSTGPSPERLYVDPTKIKQVLINLLTNAVKFTPRGGTIDLDLSVDADGAAVFEVADTGIGMRDEDIPVALTAFGQLDDSKDGTGLGLPLAKRLTELHGGTLDVASTLGKGTRVTIRLPSFRVRPSSAEVA